MEKFLTEALKSRGQTVVWYVAGSMTGGVLFTGLTEFVTRIAAFAI